VGEIDKEHERLAELDGNSDVECDRDSEPEAVGLMSELVGDTETLREKLGDGLTVPDAVPCERELLTDILGEGERLSVAEPFEADFEASDEILFVIRGDGLMEPDAVPFEADSVEVPDSDCKSEMEVEMSADALTLAVTGLVGEAEEEAVAEEVAASVTASVSDAVAVAVLDPVPVTASHSSGKDMGISTEAKVDVVL
jgi:hypothetical protein